MKMIVAIVWRTLVALAVLIALGTAGLSYFGQGVALSNSFSHCASVTPDAVSAAVPDDTNVDMWVEDSQWPLTPICHWRVGDEISNLQLLDWSYTYKYYGGLFAAAIVSILWLVAELILAARRRRRNATAEVTSL
jgi:hypothetical protein